MRGWPTNMTGRPGPAEPARAGARRRLRPAPAINPASRPRGTPFPSCGRAAGHLRTATASAPSRGLAPLFRKTRRPATQGTPLPTSQPGMRRLPAGTASPLRPAAEACGCIPGCLPAMPGPAGAGHARRASEGSEFSGGRAGRTRPWQAGRRTHAGDRVPARSGRPAEHVPAGSRAGPSCARRRLSPAGSARRPACQSQALRPVPDRRGTSLRTARTAPAARRSSR